MKKKNSPEKGFNSVIYILFTISSFFFFLVQQDNGECFIFVFPARVNEDGQVPIETEQPKYTYYIHNTYIYTYILEVKTKKKKSSQLNYNNNAKKVLHSDSIWVSGRPRINPSFFPAPIDRLHVFAITTGQLENRLAVASSFSFHSSHSSLEFPRDQLDKTLYSVFHQRF